MSELVMSSHPEAPTGKNWAALADEYAAEVGFLCDCGRPLNQHQNIFLHPDPDGFPVQGYARRMEVFFICKCGRIHSAHDVLGIDRYAPHPRSLWLRVKGLLCAAVDALNKFYAREEAANS